MILPENAIPTGSQPVDQDVVVPPVEEEPGQATQQAIDEAAKQTLVLGKFKSAEEVIPAYQELEKDHGRLGSEVGNLRKQNEMLMNLVNKVGQSQPQAQQQPPTDYDKLLDETTSAVESGDLSVGEGLKKVAALTAQKMAVMAKETYAQLDSDRTAKDYLSKFQQDHPDFQEALQSGELDKIRSTNPMHDNLSAYFEWSKNKEIAAAKAEVQGAYEKGKAEMAKLAQGADATKRVLGKSGSEARVTNTNTGPLSDADKKSGMMEVLRSVRAG
jgi:hypothetical protein